MFKDRKANNKIPPSAAFREDGALEVPARVIPLPEAISEEAKKLIPKGRNFVAEMDKPSLEDIRNKLQDVHATFSSKSAAIFPVDISEEIIAGVECLVIAPEKSSSNPITDACLINLMGGGAFASKKYQLESIPLANLLKVPVFKPEYRKPPEHKFPCAVDDVVAVYQELLKKYDAKKIGLYGACSGATLVFQAIARFIYDDIPLPGAIAAWGGNADKSRIPDTMFTNHDLDNMLRWGPYPDPKNFTSEGTGVDVKDPLVSPLYASLKKFPPCFSSAGTRDYALSSAALMHRELYKAGVESEFVVFEGMDHVFQNYPDLPEAHELYKLTAKFFTKKLNIQVHGN